MFLRYMKQIFPTPKPGPLKKIGLARGSEHGARVGAASPLLIMFLISACAVGPNYVKPAQPVPAAFKESPGWKQAAPQDLVREDWWKMFADEGLSNLEALVVIDNQNIKIAEARFRQAQALVSQARSSFFPAVGVSAGETRGRASALRPVSNSYDASLSASWEVDVWGKIRRSVEANQASAAASEADLAAAKLSAQAELATNYLSLRAADEQARFLNETVEAYQKSLELTQNLYESGIQTRSDYLQAKVQLESARAQAVDVGIQRKAFEHAIAVLIGKAPSEFSLPDSLSVPAVPLPPVVLPSTVLERRPDVAAAERRAAAANAGIGIAEAAYFPDFTLSATVGYASSALANWFTAPTRVWSLGPSLAASVFDAGLRRAQTKEAIAAYDESVATYRQTVLGAFQEVEDNLSTLTILQQEQDIRNTAHTDAKASTALITNQYKEGITSYLNVVSAQTVELNNALSALAVKKQRLAATVTLVKALGGKWDSPVPSAAPTISAPPVIEAPKEPAVPPTPVTPENSVKLTPPKTPLPE